MKRHTQSLKIPGKEMQGGGSCHWFTWRTSGFWAWSCVLPRGFLNGVVEIRVSLLKTAKPFRKMLLQVHDLLFKHFDSDSSEYQKFFIILTWPRLTWALCRLCSFTEEWIVIHLLQKCSCDHFLRCQLLSYLSKIWEILNFGWGLGGL